MKLKALFSGVALFTAASANALVIDFTDRNVWNGTNTSATYGSLTVTVDAFDKDGNATNYNVNQDFDGSPQYPCAAWGPLACESDGLGIGNDEVTFGVGEKTDVERLLVTFSETVNLDSIVFLDLFNMAAGGSDAAASEVAQAQFNGNGAGAVWTGTAADTTGFLVATLGNADIYSSSGAFDDVYQVEFFADTAKASSPRNTDFALAGIVTASVPEPASLALLGLGLIGLGVARRRVR